MDKKYKILFVCLGNICRSPAAEGMLDSILAERGLTGAAEVDSAGLIAYHAGELPDQRMRIHARRRGLELVHRSRPVTSDDFEHFDLIIGMDDSNIRKLKDRANSPEEELKVHRISEYFRNFTTWDHIPDPYYEGAEGFELVLDLLGDACNTIADRIADGSLIE